MHMYSSKVESVMFFLCPACILGSERADQGCNGTYHKNHDMIALPTQIYGVIIPPTRITSNFQF